MGFSGGNDVARIFTLFEDAGYYVVVVGVGDFGAVEGTGDEGFVGAEIVDEDFAVDLGGVERGAALPEEVGLFGFALDEGGRSRGLPRRLWIWC